MKEGRGKKGGEGKEGEERKETGSEEEKGEREGICRLNHREAGEMWMICC